jgi:hypothetical protein
VAAAQKGCHKQLDNVLFAYNHPADLELQRLHSLPQFLQLTLVVIVHLPLLDLQSYMAFLASIAP